MTSYYPDEYVPSHHFDRLVETVEGLLAPNRYTDELRAFTQSIRLNEMAVRDFERAYDIVVGDIRVQWDGTEEQEVLFERVLESREALEAFLEEARRLEDSELALEFINHGRQATISLSWLDPVVREEILWDTFRIDVDDAVLVFADLATLFGLVRYRFAAVEPDKADPPMGKYHPERYRAWRPFAEPVGKLYRQQVASSGLLTMEQYQRIMNLTFSEVQAASRNIPRRRADALPHPSLIFDSESNLGTAYGRFVQAGRQIIDIPPELMELLANTDVDDIPLSTIRLPYAAQYFHFGPQQDLELAPGWRVDGVYVEQRGVAGDIRFTVTAMPDDARLVRQWFAYPEPVYTQDFVEEFRSMDLGTAVDTVLSAKLAELRRTQAKPGGDITSALSPLAEAEGVELPGQVMDVSPELAKVRQEQTERQHPVYKAAIQRAVNALCYLAAYPDDIEPVWPEGTPLSLIEKAASTKSKEAQRAKSKLASMGYVPVHIGGKRIVEQRQRYRLGQSADRATHWRRGHWRNQVHGPARSLRKLIWVLPTLVGSGPEPETGHIYLVDPD